MGERKIEAFWTEKGVRQGCSMSPTLFNIYVMDLEEEMRKEQTGGVTIGKEKFWTITYADDMVLLAKSEEELKGMIKRFKRYLEKKNMLLSTEKLKILVFEEGRGRKIKREWKWGEGSIEEVKEIKYLGCILQKNGGTEKQILERVKTATIAMKKTWSIGEKLFKDDYGRRVKMFDALVGSVALYGAEIWRWRNEERLDRIKRKYIKWILGLDRSTPNYIVIEETKMKELKTEAMKRAAKFEDKAWNSEKKIECIRDLNKKRAEGEESKWETARSRLLKVLGIEKDDVRRDREEKKEIREQEQFARKGKKKRRKREGRESMKRDITEYIKSL